MMNGYPEEFLRVLRQSDKEIAKKMDKLEKLKASLEGVSAISYDERVQSSGEMDRMASTVAKIVDLEREIDELCQDYENNCKWCQYIIGKFRSQTQKKVIESIYINGNSVSRTAEILSMTESGVQKAKKRALKTLINQITSETV